MKTFKTLFQTRIANAPIVTGDQAAEVARTLAMAHDWLDREERLSQLTRARATLTSDLRQAA